MVIAADSPNRFGYRPDFSIDSSECECVYKYRIKLSDSSPVIEKIIDLVTFNFDHLLWVIWIERGKTSQCSQVHFQKKHGKVLVDMLYRETQTNDKPGANQPGVESCKLRKKQVVDFTEKYEETALSGC